MCCLCEFRIRGQVLMGLSERAIDESLKLRYAIEEKIRTTVKRNLEKIKPYRNLPRSSWPKELLGLYFAPHECTRLSEHAYQFCLDVLAAARACG